jgi:hypothetical protein
VSFESLKAHGEHSVEALPGPEENLDPTPISVGRENTCQTRLMAPRKWSLPFLQSSRILARGKARPLSGRWALIVLNQPFSRELFELCWHACELPNFFRTGYLISVTKGQWRVFADGGSNRVFDLLGGDWKRYVTPITRHSNQPSPQLSARPYRRRLGFHPARCPAALRITGTVFTKYFIWYILLFRASKFCKTET